MATLRNFGFAPEEPRSTPPRRRGRYVIDDESGARPLPRDEYQAREEEYPNAYGIDPLDEPVDLPGVSRERAGLLFGIGVGLGVAVLAVVAGLYLGGYVARPALGPTPVVSTSLSGDPYEPFDQAQAIEAIERARIAPVWLAERSAQVAPTSAQVESRDIQVIDEGSRAQPASAPRQRQRPAASEMSGEELDGKSEPAAKTESNGLSNELDELQSSLRSRRPTAPAKEPPLSAPTMPEEPALPAPAAPTAPAETMPPAGSP